MQPSNGAAAPGFAPLGPHDRVVGWNWSDSLVGWTYFDCGLAPYKSGINPRYLQFASKGKPTVKVGQPRTAPKTAQLSLVKVQSEPHLHTHGFEMDRLTLASSVWKILQIQVVTISTQIGSLKKQLWQWISIITWCISRHQLGIINFFQTHPKWTLQGLCSRFVFVDMSWSKMAISEIPEVAARFDPPSETTCFCIKSLGRPELFKHVVLTFPCIFFHVFYLIFFGNVMLASELKKKKIRRPKAPLSAPVVRKKDLQVLNEVGISRPPGVNVRPKFSPRRLVH